MVKDKETLLITGGLGFIGSSLAKRLYNKFKIVIVDFDRSRKAVKTANNLRLNGTIVIQSDITSPKTWISIPECKYIFHAAAQVAAELSIKKSAFDFQSNVYGTFLVAEYARKHNASIIYCNSIRVYDPDSIEDAMRRHGKVSEECATVEVSNKPQPPFALSKHLGELYLQYYSRMYGLGVISHRMSGIVGAGQAGSISHGWLSNIVRCAVNKKKFTLFGDGNQTRDVLYINDFLDLIENELKNFTKYSEGGFAVYNVGGGTTNELSINQVIEILEQKYSKKMKVEKADPRMGEPRHYCTNLTKIKKKGWPLNELRSVTDIISEVVNHYRLGGGK